MEKAVFYLVLGFLGLGLVAGCHQEKAADVAVNFKQPLPEGMVALRKISPEEYPRFTAPPDVPALRASIGHSLAYLAKPSSMAFFPYLDITHERAVATCRKMLAMCDQLDAGEGANQVWINQQVRDNFDVYQSIGAPSADGSGYSGRVLFTGYFTPTYDASLTRTGEFIWPLYKAPDDLARDPATLEVKGRRTIEGQVVPYYTRHEIETGGKLAGGELVWLRSRWEAYIITIQGSARLRLPDGKIYEVGFAGTNGYSYTSPGEKMIADGVINKDQLNLKGLGAYFESHPEAMDRYLAVNQRMIFFTERPGGPFGKLNEPVTPMATIATDKAAKDIFPRAMPAFVVTAVAGPTGEARPFSNFMMDQDTGGAIRASGRCDLYMGVGSGAEAMAGRELQEGALYYVAVKDVPASLAPAGGPRN